MLLTVKFGSEIDNAMLVETIRVRDKIEMWFNIDMVGTISNWYKAYKTPRKFKRHKITNKKLDRNKLEEAKQEKLSLVKKNK